MTPDDWKAGMENEAASVEDRPWAQDTQRAAHRVGLRRRFKALVLSLTASGLFSTLFFTAMLFANRASVELDPHPIGQWLRVNPARFDLLLVAALLLLGGLLRFGQVPLWPTLLIFGLQPIWLWMQAALITVEGVWNLPGAEALPPISVDLVGYNLGASSLSMSAGCLACVALGYGFSHLMTGRKSRAA